MTNHTNTNQPRVLLTVEQAAHRLSLSRTTMFRLLKQGQITSIRIGKARRIPAEALDTYINHLTTQQQVA
ncbi:helix-turn-helix domain-containing protein [Saccharopolyspora sp. K220]|uniref:helix-turn-helix domain-containing protein n=1 Tax=Saccharopolyspora soli TaxID=2926618 RepID=UPI001F59883B|nr:helix-turn-helix domain-containing protein [Saccharopolyspora soli]MCI2423958.1 helix-turn-helix domain-containing protein [Saccharopolyspora soli]